MSGVLVQPRARFVGTIRIPGDKSISHRALIFGAMARGETRIMGLLDAGDVRSTARCLRALGVRIGFGDGAVRVSGRGARLSRPTRPLYCGNSGTTMRILTGVLVAQDFETVLTGDDSLSGRPMGRVANPLSELGARIECSVGGVAPLVIRPAALQGASLELPVASAQVRGALLLAGLGASGETRIVQPGRGRDHTERLLGAMGAKVRARPSEGTDVSIVGGQELEGIDIRVPGDVSSAAFFIVGAAATPGSELWLPGIGLNPTRTGVIEVLRRMGAEIRVENMRVNNGEPVGDIVVRGSGLEGVEIEATEIPSLIDELPIIAVAASLARGRTRVTGAEELRVKESDRIEGTVKLIRALGGTIESLMDGFVVEGRDGEPLPGGGVISSGGDHRIAMAGIIGSGLASRATRVEETDCIRVSYPGFLADFEGSKAA